MMRYSLAIRPLLVATLAVGIVLLWYGMNSDKDDIPPLLTQLIPAGHCTCSKSTSFNCSGCLALVDAAKSKPEGSSPKSTFQPDRDRNNLGLDREQCQSFFPGLFEDISRAAKFWEGGIPAARVTAIPLKDGMARARIRRDELFVLDVRAAQEDHRRKLLGILSSIHRALCSNTNPEAHWDFEFVLSIEDLVQDVGGVGHPMWVLGRKSKEESVWLMPDFGFWSWENLSNSLGPYSEVVERIEEKEITWDSKQPQLIWRGKLSFSPKLRRGLLDAARNQPWGNVKELIWNRKNNFLSMEEHCNFKFIAHVEGRAFSSSLKYRQACRSVIVAHKLQYIQHHHYLLQADGPYQNFVEVKRDFSDLPARMKELLNSPELAKKIADNSVATFKERYLTKAAEACYWRALWYAWANVSMPTEKSRTGIRYESFVLLDSSLMMRYSN